MAKIAMHRVFFFLLSTAAAAAPVKDPTIARIREAIVDNRLTALAPDCYAVFPLLREGAYVDYDVREVHNLACGGDPDTSPRLMTFRAQPKTGKLWLYDTLVDRYFETTPVFKYACEGELLLFAGPPSQEAPIKPDNSDEATGPYMWNDLDAKIHYWLECDGEDEARSDKITEGISGCRLFPGVTAQVRCFRALPQGS